MVVLSAVLFAGLVLCALGQDILLVGGHTFEYLGVTYNDDGTSTWTYSVTSGSQPAITHWVIELDPASEASSVLAASENYAVGDDPGTGLYGLKFVDGYEDEENREVIFTLDAWCEIDDIRVGIDAGDDVRIGEFLAGPGPGTVEGNQAPVANDDSATTDENTSIGIDIATNDADTDGTIDKATVVITEGPEDGAVSVHPVSGVATYLPNPGSCGDDSFSYTIADDEGAISNEATVTVVVLCNDPPLAIDDLYNAEEGGILAIGALGVLANDVDAPGSPLTAILVTDADHGALTLHSDGSLTYVHDGSETSADSFTYKANDGVSDSNVATVSIVINPVNDPPQALSDTQSTDEDAPAVIEVLANDSDPDGDALFVDSVDSPENGVASNNGTNITYTSDPDFHGTDSFNYCVSDGNGGTATATVTVIVAPVNDPPTAQDDSAFTDENKKVMIAVLDNDDDPDGDRLRVESTTQPTSGTVSIQSKKVRYTPEDGFSGVVTFTYIASDGNGGLATATVTVAVATVNRTPVAKDDSVSTNEDTPVSIPALANDRDPDGDPLVIESSSKPLHGTSALSGASIVYTPAPDFAGVDTFTYTITDGNGGSATATVVVIVEPVNDAPLARDDSSTTNEDTSVTIPVLANDWDPDGGPLRVESVTQPTNGTVSNNGSDLTYRADPGFSGVDTFSYTVSDGRGGSATATVAVAVNTVNDPPVAQDDSAVTNEGSLVSIPVLDNDRDPDGDFLLVASVSEPEDGTVLNTRTGVSYIPEPGFQGIDSFTYTASDGNGGTDTATVTVSVASVNDPPLAREDTADTDEGVTLTIPVLLNDVDPDGDALKVESVSKPENGTAVNLGDEIEYTPNPDFNGVDQFTYTVSDGQGGTETTSVFVAVAGVNDAPVAQDDSSTTAQDEPVAISVLANDEDPDGDPLFIASTSAPANGSVSVDGGTIVYTPNAGHTGSDSFTYNVSDRRGGTDSAAVTVGVLAGGGGGATHAASCAGKVVISEVAWAGTMADSRDEWIELRNLGTTSVDLTGWSLNWRRSHPTTAEEQLWKEVELSGVLAPASSAACDEVAVDVQPAVRFEQEFSDSVAWRVTGGVDDTETGYYVLERRHDSTVQDLGADLVYDTSPMLTFELSNHGEIIMLINDLGEVVDTANASNLGRNGWAAGSTATFGTMERIDALGPDVSENWQTNMGIVIHGDDADGRPLRATPGVANSPVLEDLEIYTAIEATTIRAGETPQVSFRLSRQDRRNTGWPWISVARPGFAGQGGAAQLSRYSFAGSYGSGDNYILGIGTDGLAPGSYVFWIIYGEGEALLVPIIVTP